VCCSEIVVAVCCREIISETYDRAKLHSFSILLRCRSPPPHFRNAQYFRSSAGALMKYCRMLQNVAECCSMLHVLYCVAVCVAVCVAETRQRGVCAVDALRGCCVSVWHWVSASMCDSILILCCIYCIHI